LFLADKVHVLRTMLREGRTTRTRCARRLSWNPPRARYEQFYIRLSGSMNTVRRS
jgi:hypothetical protein